MTDPLQAKDKLCSIQQEHLLKGWDRLDQKAQSLLLKQIDSLDVGLLNQLRKYILSPSSPSPSHFVPFDSAIKSGNHEQFLRGKSLLKEGKVGCLLVAGGQGTRLQFDGPKGMFPVSCFKRKTLFQLFAEKTLAASKQTGQSLPLAIMTSPLNDQTIKDYFQVKGFFGLSPNQVFFYPQTVLPFLDPQAHLFLDTPGHIAEGPDGNGGALHCFVESGIWEQWHHANIKSVISVLIDNPLADPFDAELVGFHQNQGADVTIKSTRRESAQEAVGVIVKENGKIRVKEYSEIPPAEKEAHSVEGKLKYPLANLSLFCFSMPFIKKMFDQRVLNQMPFHSAFKAAPFLTHEGATQIPSHPNAWKFERFIFDILPFAKNISVLEYPRFRCFSPLKYLEGKCSLKTLQKDMQHLDNVIFEEITGVPPQRDAFELSQEFYYPLPALLKKWKGRPLPENDYIEP